MLQGLCLGGSYGGAITYVAEHVPEDRRGYYTGWLQTSPTLGIVVSLIVIIATRSYFGETVFNDWAWRIPFPVLVPAGVRHHVHAGQLRGVAGLRGDQGQGAHEQESVARGLPQSRQSQIRGDRHHRGVGRGRGLVLQPVLGAVLPADGFQVGHAHQLPHRGYRAGHRDPDTRPVRLAVRYHRPQAGDPGRILSLRR